MAYSLYVKEKARQLRREEKLTIDELVEQLSIPRTTIYGWVRELLAVDPATIKFQRKSNSGRLSGRRWRSQYGVLQVRTSDTYLRARIDAWMDAVRGEWP